MASKILLVNPPIYDFAAYDFWLQAQVFVEKTGVLVCGQSIIPNYFNFFEGGLLCVRNSGFL